MHDEFMLAVGGLTLTHLGEPGGEADQGGGWRQEEGRRGGQEEVCSVQHGLQLQQPPAESQYPITWRALSRFTQVLNVQI